MKKLFFLILIFTLSSAFANCDGHTQTFTIVDPKDGLPFVVSAKVYRPDAKKFPVIFILPPIVGETILDRNLAKTFCRKNMGTYILNVVKATTLEEEILDIKVHDFSYLRALTGVRHVRKILETDPSVSGDFGILGMSLGGMLASYISGVEKNFRASVFIVAAGNVPSVLTYSNQKLVVAQREARQEYYQIPTMKDYEKFLKQYVTQDPLDVIQNIEPGTSYFFIAQKDTTVPTKNQVELMKNAQSPLVYTMRGNHFGGMVKAGTLHARKITKFFRQKFDLSKH